MSIRSPCGRVPLLLDYRTALVQADAVRAVDPFQLNVIVGTSMSIEMLSSCGVPSGLRT